MTGNQNIRTGSNLILGHLAKMHVFSSNNTTKRTHIFKLFTNKTLFIKSFFSDNVTSGAADCHLFTICFSRCICFLVINV